MPHPRTALVTGAGGFCATHLATHLTSEANCAVIGLGKRPQPLHSSGLTDYVECNVSDYERVARIIREARPDWVFHLAGTAEGSRQSVFATNARGTVNVLRAILSEHATAAAVVVGSAAEYGSVPRRRMPITEQQPCRPRTPYGTSKYAATRAALRFHRAHGLRLVVARPFNMIGRLMPPSLVLGAVLTQIRSAIAARRRPAVVTIGPCDAHRDFVLVEDVAAALTRMVQGPHWGEVFNLCSGKPTAIRSLLRMVARAVDWPIKFTRDRAVARRRGVSVAYGSYQKAAKAFGFTPNTDLEEAIHRICHLELGAAEAIR